MMTSWSPFVPSLISCVTDTVQISKPAKCPPTSIHSSVRCGYGFDHWVESRQKDVPLSCFIFLCCRQEHHFQNLSIFHDFK